MKLLCVSLLFVIFFIRSECQGIIDYEPAVDQHHEEEEQFPSSVSDTFEEKPEEQSKIAKGMNCAKSELERFNELLLAYELLKKGDVEISKQISVIEENTILVLGNAGSGKTTFTQFMAGDNDKLMSFEVGNDTGEFLIVDGSKIGSSPIESQTLYPEQVKLNKNVTYTDTPGFSDTRSSKHELVATYVMKKYLENIKNVKIVLLVTYNSVQYGVYKNDFIDLLRNVQSFLKDIEKYKDSIVLIASKVPNTYKITRSDVKLIPDHNIIISIGEFINKVKTSIKQKLDSNSVTDSDENVFLKNAVKIMECLEEVDEKGNHKRINIFRRPSEQGPLSSMTLIQKEKESIKKTLDNIEYSEITENSLGYSLSSSAKIYLDCLFQYINEKIDDLSSYTFHLVNNHYQMKIQNYTDIYDINNRLHSALGTLEILKHQLEDSKNYTNFMSTAEKFLIEQNMHSIEINKYNFSEINNYLKTFQPFTTNNYNPFSPLIWSEHLKPVISNIKENIIWYDTLIEIFNRFSSYDVQKLRIENQDSRDLNYTDNPLKLIYSDSNHNININYFNDENLTESKSKEFNEILSLTFKETDYIACDSNGKYIFKGYFVKLSSAFRKETLGKYCGELPLKVVIIQAYTVFIDSDIDRVELKGIKLMVTAIKWEVIGQRNILIDGLPGKSHDKTKANDGKELGDNGENGLPGFFGGNGGIFLGIGLHFKNIQNLFINVNGGNGGSGQDGGNGAKGKPGKHGYEKFHSEPSYNNYSEVWTKGYTIFPMGRSVLPSPSDLKDHNCAGKIETYFHEGDCGDSGGSGGIGGVGGFGGHPGKIILITVENNSITIPSQLSPGNPGIPGKGGKAGLPGNKGVDSICYKLSYTDYYTRPTTSIYWICSNSTYGSTMCSDFHNSPDGHPGIIIDPTIYAPEQFNHFNFSEEYEHFETLLKLNRKKIFLSRDIIKFEDNNFKEYVFSRIHDVNS